MIKDLLSKIIVTSYIWQLRIKEWLLEQDFKKRHIKIGFENSSLKITIVEHHQYVASLENKFGKIQGHQKPKDTIRQALTEARENCNFVIFQHPTDENKFIQFWTGKRRLDHDFPMSQSNGLHPYRLNITGLLAELGFINKVLKEKIQTFHPYKHYFWLDKVDDDLWEIKARFHKNVDLGTQYTYTSLKDILKVNPKNLVIKFG